MSKKVKVCLGLLVGLLTAATCGCQKEVAKDPDAERTRMEQKYGKASSSSPSGPAGGAMRPPGAGGSVAGGSGAPSGAGMPHAGGGSGGTYPGGGGSAYPGGNSPR